MQQYQVKSGVELVRAWSWDSGKHAAFAAWQVHVALVAAEVGHLAHAVSPVKRTKRRESEREHLW